MQASVLLVRNPASLVVRLEGTGAVVELQLRQNLTPDEMARARAISPLQPCNAVVHPGPYTPGAMAKHQAGVFVDSEARIHWPVLAPPVRIPLKRKLQRGS